MSKLNSIKLANSLAISFAIVHTSFDVLSLFAPELLKLVFNSWFHGFNLRLVILEGNVSYDYSKIALGWLTSVAVAWVIGFSIGFFYNSFLRED